MEADVVTTERDINVTLPDNFQGFVNLVVEAAPMPEDIFTSVTSLFSPSTINPFVRKLQQNGDGVMMSTMASSYVVSSAEGGFPQPNDCGLDASGCSIRADDVTGALFNCKATNPCDPRNAPEPNPPVFNPVQSPTRRPTTPTRRPTVPVPNPEPTPKRRPNLKFGKKMKKKKMF
jgi:hypothetical protein